MILTELNEKMNYLLRQKSWGLKKVQRKFKKYEMIFKEKMKIGGNVKPS